MPIGDILESIGGAIDPSESQNPYMPKLGAALAGGLSGFSAGRAGRRKLAAADTSRRLEAKLGFPLDVFHRLSSDAQVGILERAGLLGDRSLDEPLPQFEGLSMRHLQKYGAPASVTEPPTGTGIFEGIPGGPAQDLSGQQMPRYNAGIPPLNAVPKTDVSGLLASRYGTAMPQDLGGEARARASGLLGDIRDFQLKNILPKQLENMGYTGEATQALTRSRDARRKLAEEASMGATVPGWLVQQLHLGGLQLPKDEAITYRALDAAMKNSGGFQEFQNIVSESIRALTDRVSQGKEITDKDVQAIADKELSGRLGTVSVQMGLKPQVVTDLFVDRVWQALKRARSMRDLSSDVPNEEPYSLPGELGNPGIESPGLDTEE